MTIFRQRRRHQRLIGGEKASQRCLSEDIIAAQSGDQDIRAERLAWRSMVSAAWLTVRPDLATSSQRTERRSLVATSVAVRKPNAAI